MFEEGNLGSGSTMRFVMDNVLVDGTHERGGNPPASSDGGNNPIPFNLGDCMVAGTTAAPTARRSSCANSMLQELQQRHQPARSNVGQGNGSGPTKALVADIRNSVIAEQRQVRDPRRQRSRRCERARTSRSPSTEISRQRRARGASFEVQRVRARRTRPTSSSTSAAARSKQPRRQLPLRQWLPRRRGDQPARRRGQQLVGPAGRPAARSDRDRWDWKRQQQRSAVGQAQLRAAS